MLDDLNDDENGLHTLESGKGSFLVAASPEGDTPVACIAYR